MVYLKYILSNTSQVSKYIFTSFLKIVVSNEKRMLLYVWMKGKKIKRKKNMNIDVFFIEEKKKIN